MRRQFECLAPPPPVPIETLENSGHAIKRRVLPSIPSLAQSHSGVWLRWINRSRFELHPPMPTIARGHLQVLYYWQQPQHTHRSLN